jgi:putative transposase
MMSPGPTPAPITVSPAQHTVLTALLRRSSCPQALALRIRLVLGAAAGRRNEPLARQLGCAPNTARKWRSRWAAAEAHLAVADEDRPALERAIAAALADAPRPGAPTTFTAEQIIHIINLACHPPAQFARPVTAWTPRELADEAVKQGLVTTISARSVERFLKRGRSAAASQPLLAQRQDQSRGADRLR